MPRKSPYFSGLWSPSLSLNNPLIRPATSWGLYVVLGGRKGPSSDSVGWNCKSIFPFRELEMFHRLQENLHSKNHPVVKNTHNSLSRSLEIYVNSIKIEEIWKKARPGVKGRILHVSSEQLTLVFIFAVYRGWTYYPVLWGLFHKPWHKDPVMNQSGMMERHVRGLFPVTWSGAPAQVNMMFPRRRHLWC